MMKKLIILALCIGTLTVSSCGSSDEPGTGGTEKVEPALPIELTATQARMVDGYNKFAINLMRETIKSELKENSNTLVSPMSMEMALSLLANGADGETIHELASLLGIDGKDLPELNALNRRFLDLLPEIDSRTRLSMANSVWSTSGAVLPSYTAKMAKAYDAEAMQLGGSGEDSRRRINSWIEEKTDGMIKDMLLSAPQGPVVLTNALYFRSVWNVRFDRKLTKPAEFTCQDGTRSRVQMMDSGDNAVSVSETVNASIIDLPYGNGAYMMHVVLPHEGIELADVVGNLTVEDLLSDRGKTPAGVRLPRFDLGSSHEMKDVVAAMGAKSVFHDADLSKMLDGGEAVGSIHHNCHITVDEHGSEAAAATVIDIFGSTQGSNTVRPAVLEVNRPFMFVINEQSTGAILFMGRVSELAGE